MQPSDPLGIPPGARTPSPGGKRDNILVNPAEPTKSEKLISRVSVFYKALCLPTTTSRACVIDNLSSFCNLALTQSNNCSVNQSYLPHLPHGGLNQTKLMGQLSMPSMCNATTAVPLACATIGQTEDFVPCFYLYLTSTCTLLLLVPYFYLYLTSTFSLLVPFSRAKKGKQTKTRFRQLQQELR